MTGQLLLYADICPRGPCTENNFNAQVLSVETLGVSYLVLEKSAGMRIYGTAAFRVLAVLACRVHLRGVWLARTGAAWS